VTFHFGLTAFLLAEPTLIASGAYVGTTYSTASSGNHRVDNIFRTMYILPYAIMFVLMIIFAIFRHGIGSILKACIEKCSEKERQEKSQMIQNSKLLNILSEKQRNTLRSSF